MITVTLICLGLFIVASISDGMVEGFEFDGRSFFEKRFGVKPHSFWGSLSHQNKDTLWFKITGGTWDFYHLADDIRKHFYIAPAGILFFIHYGVNIETIALVVSAYLATVLFKRVSMAWVRNPKKKPKT